MIAWIVGFVGSMDKSGVRSDVVLVNDRFMYDEFFMEVFKRDGCISPISSINDGLVCFIVQTSQNFGDNVFMVHGFPHDR